MAEVLEQVMTELNGIRKTFDERVGKNDATSKKLEEQASGLEKTLKDLETRFTELANRQPVSVPGVNDGKEKFEFCRAIKGIVFQNWEGAEYERDVFKETEKRAVQVQGTDSLGGYLLPVQVTGGFIEDLRKELIVSELGATILPNLKPGVYEWTRKKTHGVAQSRSEVGNSQRTNITFDQLRISPKAISAYIPFSERLTRASNPAIESLVQDDLRKAAAERMEELVFFGSGRNNQPLGLAYTPNIIGANNTGLAAGERHYFNTDAAAGHRLTHEDIITLEGTLSDANALVRGANIKMATNNGILRNLRTEKYWTYDNTSTPTNANLPFRAGLPMTPQEVMNRIGYPMVTSNIIPNVGDYQGTYTGTYDNPGGGNKKLAYGFFGNWLEVFIAIFQNMSITASRDASDVVAGKFFSAFVQNQIWVKIDMEFDVGIRHEESMIVLNNLKTQPT